MFVVDTNVLVYAANADAAEHAACRDLLESWRSQRTPWYLTWGVVYEFLRVTTHPRVFTRPWKSAQSLGFVEAVLASPSVKVLAETERHPAILRELVEEVPGLNGNLLHDAHTAALMKDHGVPRIVTRDTDFHRFPFIDVVDPLAP